MTRTAAFGRARRPVAATLLWLTALLGGCGGEDDAVVVYTALDRGFSEPILERFERETGIAVRAVYDTESTKTVGLTNRIRAEKDRPRCDVFWNNEILNTLRLGSEGLLRPMDLPSAKLEGFDPMWRDEEGLWYGFAARARVLIVNTDEVPEEDFPRSIEDLADPRWKGRTGIAKPLFGTTASHVACLFATRGEDGATGFLRRLAENDIQVHGGNKGCARAVAEGRCAFALTDTDDAIIEKEAGHPVALVYPDQGEDEEGTLLLPNTLSVIEGAPHPSDAERLVAWLLRPEIEEALADGPSAQIPLHRDAEPPTRVPAASELKRLEVDFERAAQLFPEARAAVEEVFLD